MFSSIRMRLIALAVSALLGILVVAGAGYYGFTSVSAVLNNINIHSIPSIRAANRINLALAQVRIRDGRAILDETPEEMAATAKILKSDKEHLDKSIEDYRNLVSLPGEKEAFDALSKDVADYYKSEADLIAHAHKNEDAEAKKIFFELKTIYDNAVRDSKTLIELNNKETSRLAQVSADLQTRILGLMIGVVLIALSVVGVLAFTILRSVIGGLGELSRCLTALAQLDIRSNARITSKDEIGLSLGMYNDTIVKLKDVISHTKESANAVSTASSELSSTMDTVAASTEEQSAALSEIASAVEETSSSAVAVRGKTEQSVKATEGVDSELRNATDSLKELQESAAGIQEARDVIQDISEQVNLLALNAAIEAARAGEAGRGFAVVADEVRKLASSTGVSTQQITERIAKLQQSVERMTASLARSGSLMSSVKENAHSMITSVTEQTTAVEQITRSIHEFRTQMEHMVRSIHESKIASSSLSETAVELSSTAGQFKT